MKICCEPGCNRLQVEARCEKHRRPKPERPRETTAQRGYGATWQRVSIAYRQQNPLCVNCLLRGKVSPVECVDHIVPVHSVPGLRFEWDNFAALDWACHSHKTNQEPRHQWEPVPGRVVVCGLPGVGKSTYAATLDCPVFDADTIGATDWQDVEAQRRQFIKQHSGPCVVIVASTVTASVVAGEMRGSVKHLTLDESERAIRLSKRM